MQEIKKIISLIKNHLYGSLDETGKKELQEWLDSSPGNSGILERISNSNRFRERIRFYEKFEGKRTWEKISKGIYGPEPLKARISRKRRMIIYPAAAAVIGLILLLTIRDFRQNIGDHNLSLLQEELIHSHPDNIYLVLPDGRQVALDSNNSTDELGAAGFSVNAEDNTLTVGAGERSAVPGIAKIVIPRGVSHRIELSDGSSVWLNSESELSFPTDFSASSREVTLRGEALFDVAADKNKPFVVNTGDIRVRVLGTTFNITSYQRETITTLVSGSVVLNSSGEDYSLLPGQQAIATTQGVHIKEVDTNKYTAWTRNTFIFDNEKLDTIMETLSRWYDVEIDFTNDALGSLHFTCSSPRSESLNHILHILETTGLIKFQIHGKTVTVSDI